MHWIVRALRAAAVGVVIVLAPTTVAAHELRDVGEGRYAVEIGFRDEPAYLSQPNALFLVVTEYGSDGGPVEGLAGSLEAEVQKDGATLPLSLLPGDEPGVYSAPFIPTALGDYTFRLIGDIEGVAVDESFSSSPNTFASVEPLDRYQFPVNAPAGADLVAELDAANARAARAETLAYVGIAAGALGLLVGIAGVVRARRSRAPVAAAPTEASGAREEVTAGRALIR